MLDREGPPISGFVRVRPGGSSALQIHKASKSLCQTGALLKVGGLPSNQSSQQPAGRWSLCAQQVTGNARSKQNQQCHIQKGPCSKRMGDCARCPVFTRVVKSMGAPSLHGLCGGFVVVPRTTGHEHRRSQVTFNRKRLGFCQRCRSVKRSFLT